MDVWKENIFKNLKSRELELRLVGKFLVKLKKKFREEEEELVKIAELNQVEQKNLQTINKFVQMFFFLNQQFITWRAMAGRGSYFVTMYRRTEIT